MPTLTDIAKIAGVGVMSASRVINGTRKVSRETEEKVREAVKRIGYEPNEAAKILKGYRAHVIGLIVPDLANPFFSISANAIQEQAREAGYMTLLASSGHSAMIEQQQVELMLKRNVAGLIVASMGVENDAYVQSQQQKVPIVAFDRPIGHMRTDMLLVDNRQASAAAVKHLQAHGHREILCLTDEETMYTTLERLVGYKEAMRAAKLPVRVCVIGRKSGSMADQLPPVLSSKPAITAIFAASDLLAVNAFKELRRMKLNIPSDIALIGFDDFDAACLTTPTITVVSQPIAELGTKAIALLLQRIANKDASGSEQITLKTELVIRQSCGCRKRFSQAK